MQGPRRDPLASALAARNHTDHAHSAEQALPPRSSAMSCPAPRTSARSFSAWRARPPPPVASWRRLSFALRRDMDTLKAHEARMRPLRWGDRRRTLRLWGDPMLLALLLLTALLAPRPLAWTRACAPSWAAFPSATAPPLAPDAGSKFCGIAPTWGSRPNHANPVLGPRGAAPGLLRRFLGVSGGSLAPAAGPPRGPPAPGRALASSLGPSRPRSGAFQGPSAAHFTLLSSSALVGSRG